MKPRKMQSRVMWAVVDEKGKPATICDTRSEARWYSEDYPVPVRVVRVRVTEAP